MTNTVAIVAVAAGIIFSVAPDISFGMAISDFKDEHQDGLCRTPECLHMASEILKRMNQTISPCDNFYQFACGRLEKSTVANPYGEFGVGNTLPKQKRSIQIQISKASPSKPSGFREQTRTKLTRMLFRSCMNTAEIEKQGLKPLHRVLRLLGGWPIREGYDWDESKFSRVKNMHESQRRGYSADDIINMNVNVNLMNHTAEYMINLDPRKLDLHRKFLLDDIKSNDIWMAYFHYMVDIAVKLGVDESRAERTLWQVLQFEQALAAIHLKKTDSEYHWNPMSVSKPNRRYPSSHWERYISNLLPSNQRVNGSEVELNKLLKRTPKTTQANYILWRLVEESVRFLNKDVRNRRLQFLRVLNNGTKTDSRREECKRIVEEFLPKDVNDDLVLDSKNFFKNILAVKLFRMNHADEKLRKPVKNTRSFEAINSSPSVGFHYPDEQSVDIPAVTEPESVVGSPLPEYIPHSIPGYIPDYEMAPGLHYGNEASQAENDVVTAYLEYQYYVSHYGPDLKLPGLDYTPHQIFWIGFTNNICTSEDQLQPASQWTDGFQNSYNSVEFRVNNRLSKIPGLLADFNCPVTSAPSSAEKCVV